MEHCKDCKFFQEAGEYQNWGLFGFGECSKMPLFWNATEWDTSDTSDDDDKRVLLPEYKDQLAFVQDGSDYKAYFIVSPEFGCILHERKT